jgi:hypothetical protein
MRNLILAVALFPALALAAPPAPLPWQGGAPAADGTRRDERQRRMRLERALGLAEALDLDEQGALRLRAVLARHDERRAPVERDVMEAVRTLRAAAAGQGVGAPQVDAAIQRLHDGRERLARLDVELLAELTSGVTPDRKARAALFLARFRPGAEPARGGPGAAGYPAPRQPSRPPGAMSVPDRPAAMYGGPPGTPPPPPGGARPPVAQPMPGGTPPAPPPAAPPPGPGGDGPELEDWFSGE